jgi:hypothetical protein
MEPRKAKSFRRLSALVICRVSHGDCEVEHAAFVWLGLDPDAAAMALDSLFAYGQANPGAGVFLARV